MRRLGDYVGEMRTRSLLDREIERLLAGAPMENRDLALLSPLVEGLRSSADHLPSEAQVRIVAARAATVVLERSQHLTDPEVSHRRRQMVGLSPRLAAVILAVLMVPAMTGVALAADSAIPGDALYGLDRALEAVGIGAGSTEERLDEAEMLATVGKTDEAVDHAVLALAEGADASDAMARQALEAIAGLTLGSEDRSALIALLAYISENAGDELGADGREFGQAVAALAREVGSSDSAPNNPSNVDPGQGEGPPVEPGNTNGQPGQGEGAQDPNQGDQGSQGDGQANGDQGNQGNQGGQGSQGGQANGNQGNPNGNGDQGPPDEEVGGPPQDTSPEDGPSEGEATTESDPVAPDSGGDDAGGDAQGEDDQGDEQGPSPDSPSVTAPGRQGKSS